ncbi:hypothetical protein PDIG_75020 [Penicillium digitatum PHI26]|uniref:Uncharacterized protein n=2 Tax=Penicillium digitatum TaxID=36651 RepID=K9FX12_PEND2|nr:hypothetical protein PDIP_45480 [Penicillium digitatum Pd1]EKV07228.1 hypothetical protein PDIG_75020 [Penicillium digitatum PHI26]EKV14092.1 hypothetical protein PDIP_45480 [Penicillium digitatum Pd1]
MQIGCPRHHCLAIELPRISTFHPYVDFLYVQVNMLNMLNMP